MPDTTDLPDGETAPKGIDRFFSQEEVNALIEKTRQQEKDKLYPQLNKNDERYTALNDELKELRKFQRSAEKTEADRQKAIEDAQRAKEEAELSAKDLLARRDQEFNARLTELQESNAAQIALLQKENELARFQAYVQRRAAEESESIAPELLDLIDGNTPEEVESRIELLKAKTESIANSLRGAATRQRAAMPGVAASAGTNGIGPLDTPGDRQYSASDIESMGLKDYAAFRQKVGLAGAHNQGLFRM